VQKQEREVSVAFVALAHSRRCWQSLYHWCGTATRSPDFPPLRSRPPIRGEPGRRWRPALLLLPLRWRQSGDRGPTSSPAVVTSTGASLSNSGPVKLRPSAMLAVVRVPLISSDTSCVFKAFAAGKMDAGKDWCR